MKKIILSFLVCPLFVSVCAAQNSLSRVLPLLQQSVRTPAQTQQVISLFRSSQDPTTVFAAGASLIKNPPAKNAEPAFLNTIMQGNNPLKTALSAIILTSMGSVYEELTPILKDASQASDPTLRAYAAGAYALTTPEDKTYTSDVVRLYILDANLAQRAMNMLAQTDEEQFSFLKKASADKDPQVRGAAAAWLGYLHTQAAITQLLKRAKSEKEETVQTQLAAALAKTPDLSLAETAKGLSTSYKKPTATTYDLALAFMTGHGVDSLKTALLSKNQNERINALRSAAYMAGVLSNPDGFSYSSDRSFDIHLLKGLIAPISAIAQYGNEIEKPYAQTALTQIEKLM